MDLMQAITAHIRVSRTLSSYVVRPDRSLNASHVGAIDQCTLGRWIIGDGSRYRGMPEYRALLVTHARFHRAAAEIVRRADSGEVVEQEIALDSPSEYADASAALLKALMFLYGKISSARYNKQAV